MPWQWLVNGAFIAQSAVALFGGYFIFKNDIGLADVYSNIYLIVNKDCESDKNIQQIIQIIKAVVAAAMEK